MISKMKESNGCKLFPFRADAFSEGREKLEELSPHPEYVSIHLTEKSDASRKHAYINLTPLNPTFIQQNWGLQEYILFFLFLLKNIDCGYSLEPPRRGGSNE